MTEANNKTVNASIVICNWRYTSFKKVYPQGKNSLDRIRQAGCSMETFSCDKNNGNYKLIMTHNPADNPINENTECLPIRISDPDEVNLICSDWCTSGSPLKELNYDSVPRWWPVDWIFQKPGELPDHIVIDLGKLSPKFTNIILDCEVVKKPTAEVMCTLFSDIFIEGIDDQNLIIDRKLDNDKDKNDDIGDNYDVIGETMFKKKSSSKEKEVKSEVSKLLETPEQTNETAEENVSENISTNNDNKEKTMSEKIENTETTTTPEAPAKKTRKKVPTWVKITGGVLIVAAATTGTVMIVNKIKSGDSKKQ